LSCGRLIGVELSIADVLKKNPIIFLIQSNKKNKTNVGVDSIIFGLILIVVSN
jgi:hypothetical protein